MSARCRTPSSFRAGRSLPWRNLAAWTRRATMACSITALLATAGCSSETRDPFVDEDLGAVEKSLSPGQLTVYPGLQKPDGGHYVRQINGYFNGEETGYWFFGFASRQTADIFIFCKKSDSLCPFDSKGHAQWSHMVGQPVFSHIPPESGFSPFWVVWVVQVPDDYVANSLKSVTGIFRARDAGRVQVDQHVFDHGGTIGKDLTIMHCAHVIAGTTLDRVGEDLVNKPGTKMRVIESRTGWHKQHKVTFFDFTASEGVSAPDPISQSRPLMRTSDIFVLFRDCAGGSKSLICQKVNSLQGSVSERGTETDFTGDGDKRDTNNVLIAFPYTAPVDPKDADRSYSPLWRVNAVKIRPQYDADVQLIDNTLDQKKSSVRSIADVRKLLGQGRTYDIDFVSEGMTGTAIPGNDGLTFFSCPSQVAWDAP